LPTPPPPIKQPLPHILVAANIVMLLLYYSQVGHLPVLHPGEAFCYTSGCELETEIGSMEGCFHMAVVDPATARRGMVGDQNIIPLQQDFEGTKFEMPVGPFPLVYPDTNK